MQFTTAGRSVEAPLDILPVLPSDIEVTSTDSAGTAPGITMSSLFGRDSSDVVASCRETEFRCAVHGTRPVVGDRAGLTIRRALFYPAPTEADVPLATGAAALAGSPR
ncbi:hypothetical protein [Rhodococcus wratislaviensis]|uniref:hypothetical protein n=1 Tax=Rhodococcus wratislaviensis TaxID=44752 RepID=UPI001788E2F5|nr:hypothetical protein [Rhodococcus wratislaviensis]